MTRGKGGEAPFGDCTEDVGPQLPGHVPDVPGIIWGWVGGGEVVAVRGQRGANASLVLLQVNPRWPS